MEERDLAVYLQKMFEAANPEWIEILNNTVCPGFSDCLPTLYVDFCKYIPYSFVF